MYESVFIALKTTLSMFAYAVPGYYLTKSKKISENTIASFAILLVYICAPFQILDTMTSVDRSPYNTKYLFIMLGMSFFFMSVMLAAAYFVLRNKQHETRYRICTIATALGNCGFMGIPLLRALLPEYPEACTFASMYFISMNTIMWTVASSIIAHDPEYIKPQKILLNPSTFAMAFGLAIYLGRIPLAPEVRTVIETLSKMSTPLCMLILGMRLGVVPLLPIFTDKLQYIAVGCKLFIFPLLTLGLCKLLPLDPNFVRGLYIICCVPVGNVVLSFSEMLGEGQDTAANVVLLSTILSTITIPIMLLLV
jgi:Predicted permeases